MQTGQLPRMASVRQRFPASPGVDISKTVQQELSAIGAGITPGARVAVAVGSRGITNLQMIVSAVLEVLKGAGAKPFIVPAMGSHGGATPEGQTELLGEYGVSEKNLQVPIRAAMDVKHLGKTDEGFDVYFSAEALKADGIVVVNRVKPHTDFSGSLGSGILKMIVVGLGKRIGAANFHVNSSRHGYEKMIRAISRFSLRSAPILCGVGIVENQRHETARISLLKPDELEDREGELFQESKRLMPKLPFQDIDLLIIDRIGKNISGAGMDPNIIGRSVHGYSSFLGEKNPGGPTIRRIFVRDLTPETHGNGIGIGFADFTTTRLVRAFDDKATYVNAMTALTPQGAKIPIHFETDREAISQALHSAALSDIRQARVVRIADTLSLENLQVSEACLPQVEKQSEVEATGSPAEMSFDAAGNLAPLLGH